MSELAVREGRGIALHRIGAMVLRYWYVLMSSWPRLLELVYWPTLQIITWGFLQSYIAQNDSFFARAGGTLIGAVSSGTSCSAASSAFPFRFWKRCGAQHGQPDDEPAEADRIADLADGDEPRSAGHRRDPDDALGVFFFDFNFYSIGLPLIAFFCNLIFFSWSLGIFVSGLVLRNGLGAESIVWTMMFCDAARLHLLSRQRAAALAAIRSLGAAADLCVRGDAGAADRPRFPGRSDA